MTIQKSYKQALVAGLVLVMMASLLAIFTSTVFPGRANSLSGADFRAGRIVDDSVFYNSNTMSAAQIQQFLNSKMPSCDTNGTQWHQATGRTRAQHGTANGAPPPYICLKDYSQAVPAITNSGSDLCSGSISAGTKTAAQIIHDVARACGVNPQALIVLLQKEQSLITDDWPWPIQYRSATGYGCPDTAPCDAEFYGFFNQVYQAARAYKRYQANPNNYNYRAGRHNTVYFHPGPCKTRNASNVCIEWHPITYCGNTNLYIENQATAGLYIYTPYQPNQAALNNLHGTGNECSSYGNRNFWRMFNDWFGSTLSNDTTAAHPKGTLISMNNRIFLIGNGVRHHISNASIFESYNYKWNEVKPATIGDRNLPAGESISYMMPGVLFRSSDSSVYVTVYENGNFVKKVVSYNSFVNLGYKWEDVKVVPKSDILSPDSPTVMTSLRHPDGTLIDDGGRVYLLDHGTRRYVNQYVFESHRWKWSSIVRASSQDKILPIGARMLLKEGSVLYDGTDLFITRLPASGPEIKVPIAPWSCFADKFKYTLSEAVRMPKGQLPQATAPVLTC